MNIKNKIALNLSLLFSVFLGTILIIIYLFFSEFRNSEFVNVLKDRISTISNYFNEDEAIVDESKMINDTPTYSIHQEEIEVFNEKFEPIFSNITGKKNIWNEGDPLALKNTGSVYRRDTKAEIYGEKIGGRYFLIASEDFMGKEKLKYLGSLMLISFHCCKFARLDFKFSLCQTNDGSIGHFSGKNHENFGKQFNRKTPGNRQKGRD